MQHSRVISNSKASCSPASVSPSLRVGPNDFELLKVVGQGSFGKVLSRLMQNFSAHLAEYYFGCTCRVFGNI